MRPPHTADSVVGPRARPLVPGKEREEPFSGGVRVLPSRENSGAARALADAAHVNPLALLAPLFFAFELWQLFVSERYLGIKRIRVNVDPRELPMSNGMAAFWAGGLLVYLIWMTTLLLHPAGRAQGIVLLATTALGYALRAATPLKWTLVILTFEGSVRIGMLLSLAITTWRALMR